MSESSLPASSPSSSSSTMNTGIAFLVHSQSSIQQGLPYAIDDKVMARQKRRRTSKEDEDVLRAEYLKNPKPDKAARMQIVSKVALGEKEVQIWFQNRRQKYRRQNAEPSSSASLMSSSSSSSSSSSAMSDPVIEEYATVRENAILVEKEGGKKGAEEQADEASMSNPEDLELAVTSDDVTGEPSAVEPADIAHAETQNTIECTTVASTEPLTADTAPIESSCSQQTLPSSQQSTSQPRTSWISNRRSASFMRSSDDYASELIAFPTMTVPTSSEPSTTTTTTRNLKRTHSFVRLSMTDDGTARVITDADKTPSPPQAKSNPATLSRAAAGLRRSYSAAAFNERLVAASNGEPSPKLARTSSVGRSKDSRAWEFWCDPETRYNTSLTVRAEQEGSGSAADAIGLLRASRRVLTPNKTRMNTPILRNDSAKGKSSKKARQSTQCDLTTSGRLQTKDDKKLSDSDSSDDLPATESDKENWEPELPSAKRSRYTTASSPSCYRPRQILGENMDIMSQSTSLGMLLAKDRGKGNTGKKDSDEDPEQDDELRSFMNGGGLSGRTSINSAEEAGCVEGLLKLSQGNWR